ncbi:MAG: hypothetical protein BGO60_03330 [Thiobacillus sp. 65-1059]|nr:MAG: hypothetical protein BGO60_03330 [Thiobacillus sp. 65-1059]
MTTDTYAARLAVDKQIRAHRLIGRLTVSAAVDWLCDPEKPGNHDPLELVKALADIGLDYAWQHIGSRRVIYVADAFKLKDAISNLSIDAMHGHRWLFTRGETLAPYSSEPICHDMRPFNGNGLADALQYVLEHQTADGTVRTVADWLLAAADYDEDEFLEIQDEYDGRRTGLREIGLVVREYGLVVLNPRLLAIAMPAMRNVPMLMQIGFELTAKPKPTAFLHVVK